MGIVKLSYFVRFFGSLIAITSGIINQRKLSLITTLPKVFRLLPLVKPTFTDFSMVWDEFRDLDDDERDELRTILAIELDMEFDNSDEAKELLDKGIGGALSFLELITHFKR
ncbi:hypothetical protein [Runella limosa]|uniref:hypothetical protein n=1 Tax=Runella limosa TaxID=370978 RepID=UPI000401BE8F|nr:hypothetical protein [Runella limosa]